MSDHADLERTAHAPSHSDSTPTDELVHRLTQHAQKEARYKLEGEIARGGMGAILKVWDEDLRRHLAMKVILGKVDAPGSGETPSIERRKLARFLEEAQVTGQLDHPGIVPVHELGLDASGRVYFTMKLVKGRDLKHIFDLVFEAKDGWNETRALGIVLKACEALAYAHSKGVIHRDLKPANVMVGNFGEVYVMDWGLARVLGCKDSHDIRLKPEFGTSLGSVATERRAEREETPDSPLITMDGDVMGTPAYMSPEQARGEVEKLTARSDVYAIGAIIYHLLARQVPYVTPGARVSNRTVLAMVLQGPPARLESLRSDVPAELTAICDKAMSRDQGERYADTLELAEDLRAFLEHRVVAAYETGTWAETKKWVQRNKPMAAAIAAGLLALALGLIGTGTQYVRATEKASEALASADRAREQAAIAESNASLAEQRRREAEQATSEAQQAKDRAEQNAQETKLLADFQSKMLATLAVDEFGRVLVSELRAEIEQTRRRDGMTQEEVADALDSFDKSVARTNPTNVAHKVLEQTIFEPALKAIESDYSQKPLLKAMLQTPIAETLLALGLLELGAKPALEAVDIRRSNLGVSDVETLTSIRILADLLGEQGKNAEAEALLREAVAGYRTRLGDDHPDTLHALNHLVGRVGEQGRLSDAESLARDALMGCRARLGDAHPDTLLALNLLATNLQDQGKLSETDPLYGEALAGNRARLGDDSPDALIASIRLARLLDGQGKQSEAESILREGLTRGRAKLGDDHPDTLMAINNLAALLKAERKLSEAEPFFREGLAGRRAKLGDDHPTTLSSIVNFAMFLQLQGKHSEAEPLFREGLAGQRARLGDDHSATLASIGYLGSCLQRQRKFSEAEPLLREALAGGRSKLGDDHLTTLNSINNLAVLLTSLGKYSEAEPLSREALTRMRAKYGDAHANTLTAIKNYAGLLQAQGKLSEAEPLFREALAGFRVMYGDSHPSSLQLVGMLAEVLRDQAKFPEAEGLYREALAGKRAAPGDQHAGTLETMLKLATVYRSQLKWLEAELLYREALDLTRSSSSVDIRFKNIATQQLIKLYDQWHEHEPSAGHDRQAAELKQSITKD